ncbi:MAG: type II and III secretion system protein [Akkermansiaceae bacterium]|nr:type II and III secretion system protein [Akkermansiaceae bacterium]NNM30936.1 type II and III secretion system protein [Akkermansiaceae bacterium]
MHHATHAPHRTPIVLTLFLAVSAVLPGFVQAQGIAAQERIRRQGLTQQAEQLLMDGREAYAEGNFEEAVSNYRAALDTLPGGLVTANRRQAIIEHLTDGSIALSQQYRRTGKYQEARDLLGNVLVADPSNFRAKQELEYLDDPIRTNPALTYTHTTNVDKVRRLLYTGEGFYNLGRYDQAAAEFEGVLRIDPHNTAARRWLERCWVIKSDYYRAAYDETRARLLMEVDQAWEIAVPPAPGEGGPIDYADRGQAGGVVYITNKLKNIIIPVIDFEDTTVEEAVDFLRQRASELDTFELDPTKKGINFVVRKGRVSGGGGVDAELDAEAGLLGTDPGASRIKELKLRNVPIATVLDYIGAQAKLRYKVDEFAVTLLPLSAGEGEDLVTRTWQVPPTFLSDIEGEGGGDAAEADPFAAADEGGLGARLKARRPLIEILKEQGISFPTGSSATYIAGSSTLVVNNTPSNLDLVAALVENVTDLSPKMIKILTKFVEIKQENTDELSFDWVIGPFGLTDNELFIGGGTTGSGTTRTGADFVSPPDVIGIGDADQAVSNISTAGLRSGDSAITRGSIDSVLNNPNRTAQVNNVAPGILSLTGLFSDGQFQMIMRGLAQKKGADIMTAPSVTARPGQKATIEIIREFIYPTEYEPPELPNQVGTTGGLGAGGNAGIFPVTPATPTAFETRNTGVTLEIEPNVGANDYVIDLRFAPEIVEFEGFINYGSPITSPASDMMGNPVTVTITENRIEMPVFSSRRVSTGITIYDGHTVAVGGLMREDVQNVEDKVPILGDLPLIGRLFQSKSENHIKSNLIIFVTARIIDATGRNVRETEVAGPVGGTGGGAVGTSVSGSPGVLPSR